MRAGFFRSCIKNFRIALDPATTPLPLSLSLTRPPLRYSLQNSTNDSPGSSWGSGTARRPWRSCFVLDWRGREKGERRGRERAKKKKSLLLAARRVHRRGRKKKKQDVSLSLSLSLSLSPQKNALAHERDRAVLPRQQGVERRVLGRDDLGDIEAGLGEGLCGVLKGMEEEGIGN